MVNQTEPTGASQQPSKAEEDAGSTRISRRKTVTKRGRQVKAQFRALFHKKESSSDVEQLEEQSKDLTQSTLTSLIVGEKNNEVVIGVEPISNMISDEDLKANILVTTSTAATVTSSVNASPTVLKKPRPPSSQPHHTTQQQTSPTPWATATLADLFPDTHASAEHEPQHDQNAEIANLCLALTNAVARSQVLECRLGKADLTAYKLTRKSEILANSLCRASADFESTRQKLQDTIDSLRSELSRVGDLEMAIMKEQSRVRNLKMGIEKRDRELEDLHSRLGRMGEEVRVLKGEASRLRGERDYVRSENERIWAIVGVKRLNLKFSNAGEGRATARTREEEEEEEGGGGYCW